MSQKPSSVGEDSADTSLQYILSDLIVIWRVYLLWNFDPKVCIVPLVLVLATTGQAGISHSRHAANAIFFLLCLTCGMCCE